MYGPTRSRVGFFSTASVRPLRRGHRVENDGPDPLIIIETQLGLCLEDDIVRLEDDFGRA